MVAKALLDRALIEAVIDAQNARSEAKRERARAMDTVVDLLFERADLRQLLRGTLPLVPDDMSVEIEERLD